MYENTLNGTWCEPSDAIEYYYKRGLTDGLPVVPPTSKLVNAMLLNTSRDPNEEIGLCPPKMGVTTVEKVAINAVMAGCLPEYFPVVLTAIDCLFEEQINLRGIQITTHPVAPLIIINGPIRNKIGIKCDTDCFGPGTRANATIGRAVRLVMINCGGGYTGKVDKSTFGSPAKYTYCIGENEEESPWEPFHVENGFGYETNTLFVIGADSPISLLDFVHDKPIDIINTFADSMLGKAFIHPYIQGEQVFILGTEHAELIKRAGWTKEDVRQCFYEVARRRYGELKTGGFLGRQLWATWFDQLDDDVRMPLFQKPQDLKIFVAGGKNKWSLYIPTWSDANYRTKSVIREIKE